MKLWTWCSWGMKTGSGTGTRNLRHTQMDPCHVSEFICPLTSHVGRSILAKGIQPVWWYKAESAECSRGFEHAEIQNDELNSFKMHRDTPACAIALRYSNMSVPNPDHCEVCYSVAAKGRPIQTGEVASSHRVIEMFIFSTPQHRTEVLFGIIGPMMSHDFPHFSTGWLVALKQWSGFYWCKNI